MVPHVFAICAGRREPLCEELLGVLAPAWERGWAGACERGGVERYVKWGGRGNGAVHWREEEEEEEEELQLGSRVRRAPRAAQCRPK